MNRTDFVKSYACSVLITLAMTFSACAETIEWSGYRWNVRTSNGKYQGPGPNVFSYAKENVFVDNDGNLHLRITQNAEGRWDCAEAVMVESLGYGTYEWEVASRYDKLPRNVVVGLFTYSSPENVARKTGGVVGNKIADTQHEIDIEFTGAWGDANLFFTSHDPDVKPPSQSFYQSLTGDYTTHRFTWKPTSIHWESFHGHVAGQASPENPIIEQRQNSNHGRPASFEYSGPVVPKDIDEKVIMNFWLFDDKVQEKAPSDGKPQEVIIHSFRYTPLEKQEPSE